MSIPRKNVHVWVGKLCPVGIVRERESALLGLIIDLPIRYAVLLIRHCSYIRYAQEVVTHLYRNLLFKKESLLHGHKVELLIVILLMLTCICLTSEIPLSLPITFHDKEIYEYLYDFSFERRRELYSIEIRGI